MSPKRRERWYSMDGQRRIHQSALQSNAGPRRLISLIVLLVLVLIMIQQVSDPKKVGKVAGAVGLLPQSTQNNATQNNPPQSNTASPSNPSGASSVLAPQSPTDLPKSTDLPSEQVPDGLSTAVEALGLASPDPDVERQSQVLEVLLKNLPDGVKATLADRLFGILDQRAPQSPDPTASDRQAGLKLWSSDAQRSILRWIDLSDSTTADHTMLTEVRESLERWTQLEPLAGFQRSLQLAMDRALMSDLADNTPWKTTERLALARLLVRASDLSRQFDTSIRIDAVPTIAIPQLLSQTDTLRGRCFRTLGTIGRIDQPSSMELADGRKLNYSVFWLRPEDLSDQPINVYVPEGVAAARELQVGDSLHVAGLIAKRRAYASKRGGEIAPVLIATGLLLDDASEPQGPSLANNGQSLVISKELARLRNPIPWIPPVDRQIPLDLVERALSGHLGKIPFGSSETNDVDSLAKNTSVLASLATVLKFQNEIDTVVSGDNSAMLAVAPNPLEFQGQGLLGAWHGQVIEARTIRIDPNLMPGLGWKEVYALKLAPNLQVIAKDVPALWLSASALNQPICVQGLGLISMEKESQPQGGNPRVPQVVVASRVAWQSHRSATGSSTAQQASGLQPELSAGWSALLRSNWDLAFCDAIELLQGQSLTSKDTRPFYTLLAASNEPQSQETQARAYSVMEWIRRTESMKSNKSLVREQQRSVGERIDARVQIRRIQRVDVRNAQSQAWLGSNHYFQLDGLADIGPSRIEVKYGKDYEPIAYEREFPITLVATKLPAWLLSDPTTLISSSDLSQETIDLDSASSIAWTTKIRVDVSGYAYRIWRFRTPQVSAVTQDTGYQQAPMLVVDRWNLPEGPLVSDSLESDRASVPSNMWSIGSILTTLLGLLAIAWFAYRMNATAKPRLKPPERRKDRI
ncbi:MAG: hypothetical protein LW699_07145 [Pirellula sp.]|nr:hypothetical protein [Pirellula sp.]